MTTAWRAFGSDLPLNGGGFLRPIFGVFADHRPRRGENQQRQPLGVSDGRTSWVALAGIHTHTVQAFALFLRSIVHPRSEMQVLYVKKRGRQSGQSYPALDSTRSGQTHLGV